MLEEVLLNLFPLVKQNQGSYFLYVVHTIAIVV